MNARRAGRCAPSSPLLRKFSFPPTTWSSSSGSARASCENVSMSTSSGGHDPTPPNSSRCCKGQACPRPDFHEATRQIEGLRQRDSHLSNLICEQMCCMCAEHRGGFSGSVFVMRETCAVAVARGVWRIVDAFQLSRPAHETHGFARNAWFRTSEHLLLRHSVSCLCALTQQ